MKSVQVMHQPYICAASSLLLLVEVEIGSIAYQ